MARLLVLLERLNFAVGRSVAWLTVMMVLVTFAVVLLRRFDLGWIWLQESVTWMHAAVFMLGGGYTLAREGHVRVDVFYSNVGDRGRAVVDLLGTVFFLTPFTLFLFWVSLDYVLAAWQIHEGSREAGGLPYPAVPLLKSLIPLTALLLLVQAVVMGLRNAMLLFRRPRP
jgi:TRAP-type mannitol/chloroaromatic compound transport system permease small subunit